MESAPTKNPDSAPKHTADMITNAMTGLKLGTMKNAALPATAMAVSTAMINTSLAWGLRLSKVRKNGIIE